MELPDELWLLVAWAGWGAVVLFTHLILVWQCVRSPLSTGLRTLSVVVPVATPVVAWMAGRRVGPVVWLIALAGYFYLRSLGPVG